MTAPTAGGAPSQAAPEPGTDIVMVAARTEITCASLTRHPLPRSPDAAEDVTRAITVEAGLRINGAAERAVRYHCSRSCRATAPGRVASAERTPVELDRRLPLRRRQIGRESEIASAGGGYPPALSAANGAFPGRRPTPNCADGAV
jgi:hypothetical protein